MRRAGLRSVQVGIESFSDRILKKFKKGISVMRNMEMLKWVAELGMKVDYNIIIRYPEEIPEDVKTTLHVIRYAQWFAPPNLGNYSVAFDSCAANDFHNHNIGSTRIPDDYRKIYPEDVLNGIGRLLFLWVEPIALEDRHVDWGDVEKAVDRWKADYARSGGLPRLRWRDSQEFLTIKNHIASGHESDTWRLTGLYREVYLACDQEAVSTKELARQLATKDESQIETVLTELDAAGILFFHRGRALWPVPGSEDTKFGVTMGPEGGHAEAEVYAGVQA
jgi:hypothetical protein